MTLNVATKLFPESTKGGLLICGVNWGGEPVSDKEQEPQSFFSDPAVNNYRYRNRILRWFELFGHPLATKKGEEDQFEKSIVQTNWLYGQATNMRGHDLVKLCSDNADAFLYHLDALRPRLIFLMSISLFYALNERNCHLSVCGILGDSEKPRILQKHITSGTRKHRAFRVGFQRFRYANVVALPHPTGSVGLSDEYIRAFRREVSPIIEEFKCALTTG